jgi:hypothetical protein
MQGAALFWWSRSRNGMRLWLRTWSKKKLRRKIIALPLPYPYAYFKKVGFVYSRVEARATSKFLCGGGAASTWFGSAIMTYSIGFTIGKVDYGSSKLKNFAKQVTKHAKWAISFCISFYKNNETCQMSYFVGYFVLFREKWNSATRLVSFTK